jgi:hypothetical protein
MAASNATSLVVLGSSTGVTTAGTTQATATAIPAGVVGLVTLTTAASQTGATLPVGAAPGQTLVIYNSTATTGVVYPATAAGKINGGSAGAGVNLTTLKANVFSNADGADNWVMVASA